jgi:hypothetical protein
MVDCLYGLKDKYNRLRDCNCICPAYVSVSIMDEIGLTKCGFVNRGILPKEMED